jgi:hypothetical protein
MWRECSAGDFTLATNALAREYVRHEGEFLLAPFQSLLPDEIIILVTLLIITEKYVIWTHYSAQLHCTIFVW